VREVTVTWMDMLGVEMTRRMDDIARTFGVGVMVHGGTRDSDNRPNVFTWSMTAR
jgi:hypothetical protein